MRQPDYTMKLMTTYGGLVPSNQRKEKARRTFKEGGEMKRVNFDYMVPFANHFDFGHAVDDHNNLHHQLPSLEEMLVTH